MVRALGSASSKDHVGDSGLGEEQCDPQACQSFLPQNTGQSRHQPSPATVEHIGTDGNEEDDIESVIDSLLPDFSCLAVGVSHPSTSDIDSSQHKRPSLQLEEQHRQIKEQPVISAIGTEAHNLTIASLAKNGPPAEFRGPHQLSTLLKTLATENLRLLESLKQSNLVLSRMEGGVVEVSQNDDESQRMSKSESPSIFGSSEDKEKSDSVSLVLDLASVEVASKLWIIDKILGGSLTRVGGGEA